MSQENEGKSEDDDRSTLLPTVAEAWERHRGRPLMKLSCFPVAQDRHLSRFQGSDATVLEIGLFLGGSLQLWQQYFGPGATIVGADIDPKCLEFQQDGFEIFIGDQSDSAFLRDLAEAVGPINVVIDDGGHEMEQQIASFETLFPILAEGGTYLVEDVCSSYWEAYGGAYGSESTFVEYMKRRVDELNAWFSETTDLSPTEFTRTAGSIHFYPGLIAIEKLAVESPTYMVSTGETLQNYPLDIKRL